MKTLFITAIFFCCTLNTHAQGWVDQTSGTIQNLHSVQFLNSATGYITGANSIYLSTTNGGLNWSMHTLPISSTLFALEFINLNTGFISGSGNVLHKTTNAGVTWITSAIPSPFQSIKFLNSLTGYAASPFPKNTYILKTTNGGANWNTIYTYAGTPYGIKDVEILDSNNIITAGVPNVRTTNAGANWLFMTSNGNNSVSFISMNTGFGCGNSWGGADVSRTTNRGVNWVSVFTAAGYKLNSINAIDENIIFTAGETGKILRSSNGGVNWALQRSHTTKNINSIFFIDANIGWAVGDSGLILKTSNGGLTFATNTNELVADFMLHQNYPNPFNPSTIINYQLTINSDVSLNLYDVNGRLIKILESGYRHAGNYEVNFFSENLSSGIYHYSLYTNGVLRDTKKAMMIK